MFNASPVLLLLAIGLLTVVAAKAHDKPKTPNCQSFSEGVQFNDTEAIGLWHLLHFGAENFKSADVRCVEFSLVSEEERKSLEALIGNFIVNLNWETLSLKMQIPCKTDSSNKTRDYYLERLEENGSYRTLHMPSHSAKHDLHEYSRYPMRLRIIEGQYLAVMDCHEKFVFILGKHPVEDPVVSERLQKLVETYWPEED